MKQLVYGEASWLIDDEGAAAVIEHAVQMARLHLADTVEMAVLDFDGTPSTVSLVLGPATMISAESVIVDWAAPDNTAMVAVLREKSAPTTGAVPQAEAEPPYLIPDDL